MGGLRFLPLLAFGACADISGLNQLDTDGGTGDSSTTPDATDGGSGNDVATSDAPIPDVASGQTFCQAQTQSYVWCADFDEGDVTMGYSAGVKLGHWTSWSQTKPTLSNSYVSAPQSAGFDATFMPSLTFTGTPSGNVPYTFSGELRVESLSDTLHEVATVQPNPGYTLKIQVSKGGTTGWAFTITEAITGDASSSGGAAHLISGGFSFGSWVAFSLSVATQEVSVTVGSGTPQTFTRSVTGSSQSCTTMLIVDQPTTTAQWDDIRINM